jgi:hypothetical protein
MTIRSVSYGPRNWRVRWRLVRFFRRGYVGRVRWPVRIVAWLLSVGLVSLAGWRYAVLGPLAFEVAVLIVALAHDRQVRRLQGAVVVGQDGRLVEALRAEAGRQAALPRVASPGGWSVPAGVRPAWNWIPPPGITPRLDRVPLWARLRYATPFVDRFGYAWLWYHGGWDVIPTESWSSPSSS